MALHLCAEQLGKDEHHSTFICQRNMYGLSVNAATPGRQRDLVHVRDKAVLSHAANADGDAGTMLVKQWDAPWKALVQDFLLHESLMPFLSEAML